jgi:hypothetical protein
MTSTEAKVARIELKALIREAWAIYACTGEARDEAIARQLEAECRAMLAKLPVARTPMLPPSHKARTRKAKKHMKRLNPGASILAQVRAFAL